jgi:hypothetical protein
VRRDLERLDRDLGLLDRVDGAGAELRDALGARVALVGGMVLSRSAFSAALMCGTSSQPAMTTPRSRRFRRVLRQEAQRQRRQALQRRVGEHHDAAAWPLWRLERAQHALVVDVLGRLLVQQDDVLLGALESLALLVEALEFEQRCGRRRMCSTSTSSMASATPALGVVRLSRWPGMSPVPSEPHRPEELALQDVPRGLAGVAGRPRHDRAVEAPPRPPFG